VQAGGLAGDVANPIAGHLAVDPMAMVVSAIRGLLKR
jgi:hypothetical protein